MTAQDKELFSQLYDRNYKRLLYAAIRIAHNPFTAEELTNELCSDAFCPGAPAPESARLAAHRADQSRA